MLKLICQWSHSGWSLFSRHADCSYSPVRLSALNLECWKGVSSTGQVSVRHGGAVLSSGREEEGQCWRLLCVDVADSDDNCYRLFAVCPTEAWDPGLPVWKDQLRADERALHHSQRRHVWQKRHWRAPTGENSPTGVFTVCAVSAWKYSSKYSDPLMQ